MKMRELIDIILETEELEEDKFDEEFPDASMKPLKKAKDKELKRKSQLNK